MSASVLWDPKYIIICNEAKLKAFKKITDYLRLLILHFRGFIYIRGIYMYIPLSPHKFTYNYRRITKILIEYFVRHLREKYMRIETTLHRLNNRTKILTY